MGYISGCEFCFQLFISSQPPSVYNLLTFQYLERIDLCSLYLCCVKEPRAERETEQGLATIQIYKKKWKRGPEGKKIPKGNTNHAPGSTSRKGLSLGSLRYLKLALLQLLP